MLFDHDPFDAFRTLDRLTGTRNQPGSGMPMDVHRSQDQFLVDLDIPGVDPGSIDVSVDGSTLTVSAERSAPGDGQDWLVAERPRGRFSRRLNLGPQLDSEHLHAAYTDGVLTITIPIAERAKPRQVTVEHGGHTGAISAAASG